MMSMWLLVVVVVVVALLVTASGAEEEEEEKAMMEAWLRQFERPYGHHKSFTSKYHPSYLLTPGTDTYDLLLWDLYRNHNFDVDNHDSDKDMPSTDYSHSGSRNNNNKHNGFYEQNNREFNGGLDSGGLLNGMDQRGGSWAAQGWRLDRGHQQDISRKAGVWPDAATLWENTMRSDTGYGGAAGSSKLPVDMYSILALGLYTAFLAYLVYYYITTAKAEEDARSLDSSHTEKALWILNDVTRAFERWAAFEFLPQELLEEEEEEEEEESVARLLEG